ncbi:inner membrane protein [Pseudomonas sp. SLBN-26]|uniref:cell envelope integrity protein CreD n=1 Tax=Pseudomonadaceae TaxID=135621 RepID=UPI001151FE86|nr:MULTISPECIES: cell envelope integrity protein CreD [Pseudomonas]MCP1618957.1 inner membrane protein [Pseudomonas otitidis]QZX83602.1 cell envelope integrity protein CreD [Pseudomonas otitidis]TQL08179.1 inner membrane protein [Pseudomonas sp. SLBN-26]
MTRTLGFKLGAIALLILLLLIPLLMIDGLIDERQMARDSVQANIAQSSSYAQQVTGPLLVVPFRRTVREWKTHEKTGQRYLDEREQRGRLFFLPERFHLQGDVDTQLLTRGIYQARLYKSDSRISGEFAVPAHFGIEEGLEDYQFETPFLAVGISDIRGINNALKLELNGRSLDFQPGSGDPILASGVHVPLPHLVSGEAQTLNYGFTLNLQGTESLHITPVGRDSQVELKSPWPHPSFVGEFLPAEREVREDGFTARWQTSFFATDLQQALADCAYEDRCQAFNSRVFGVSFVDPVDQYLKSDRAIKYALLFICLTFAGFFLVEVLKRINVHPVQYGLVGLALAFFYLLLLSLSEHLAFGLAYALSASACVLLVGIYVSSVLHSWVRGGGFTAGLAALYGMLYGLLSAEDYALLMGSLLVFGLLACVMVLTRKLDWYAVGRPAAPFQAQTQAPAQA